MATWGAWGVLINRKVQAIDISPKVHPNFDESKEFDAAFNKLSDDNLKTEKATDRQANFPKKPVPD